MLYLALPYLIYAKDLCEFDSNLRKLAFYNIFIDFAKSFPSQIANELLYSVTRTEENRTSRISYRIDQPSIYFIKWKMIELQLVYF